MLAALESCPALVLNADFRPLSYHPLSLWSWRDTISAVFTKRANVVSSYDRIVRSPNFEIQLPSVIALKDYVPITRYPAFTRFNVFLRDRFTCQYCQTPHVTHDLTFDHVLPRCKGGRTCWENVATACSLCNTKKGGKTPDEAGMRLRRRPWKPTNFELQETGRAFPPNYLHESWRDFLYWDTELETG